MKWLTNMEKDRAAGEPDVLDIYFNACNYKEAQRQLKEYMKGKIIGAPKRTKQCSLAELKKCGLVGVYARY